jgi:hypothetical protein
MFLPWRRPDSAADYQRAEQFLPVRSIADHQRSGNATADRGDSGLVSHSHRRPVRKPIRAALVADAFDHQRLAAALSTPRYATVPSAALRHGLVRADGH